MSRSVTTEIVSAVAAEKGVAPAELDFILYEHLDCDALERLTNRGGDSFVVTFELPGVTVTVRKQETLSVDVQAHELEP